MPSEKPETANVSSVVPGSVKAKIVKITETENRSESFVVARILEAWATGRPLPFRKRKAA
jgi:hypothetical protein